MKRYENTVFNTRRNKCCGYLLESPRRDDSYKCPQHLFVWSKIDSLLPLILSFGVFFIQWQIVYNVKLLGLVGCLGFNGPLRQYFSLYRAVSHRAGEREVKR